MDNRSVKEKKKKGKRNGRKIGGGGHRTGGRNEVDLYEWDEWPKGSWNPSYWGRPISPEYLGNDDLHSFGYLTILQAQRPPLAPYNRPQRWVSFSLVGEVKSIFVFISRAEGATGCTFCVSFVLLLECGRLGHGTPGALLLLPTTSREVDGLAPQDLSLNKRRLHRC